LCLALLILSAAASAAAQSAEPLFVDIVAPAADAIQAPLTGAILDRRIVGMRLERLFASDGAPAARIELNVGARTWVATLGRVDRDVNGFRSWVGALEGVEGSHVVFTERDGIVSGLIDAIGTSYQVRSSGAGAYLLEHVDADRLGNELEPRGGGVDPGASARDGIAAADDAGTIDVLMLYSPAAMARAGGVAQIQAMASQAISDTNTIFARSAINTRVRLVNTAEFPIVEAFDMSLDLDTLESSPTAQALRNNARADLVQLLVLSPDLETCGIANVLRSLNQPNFSAYSVADILCFAGYTPTHEMGHNLSAQHGAEDPVLSPLFPYSFAYKDPVRGFRTVMAYVCSFGSCPKIPNFSNPAVLHNGAPTGTATRNNALSINNAAATAANFRQAGSTTALTAPTNLAVTVSGPNVTLRWGAVAGADSYSLLVGSSPGTANLFNAAVGNTTTVSGTVGPGTYSWRVFASRAGVSSSPSVESQFTVGAACTLPAAPQNFQFSLAGRTVTLSWAPGFGGGAPSGYVIEAGSASGLANLYNAPAGAVTAVTVQAPPGVFFVRIRSQNACGVSGPSNERVITVP
jgi:hypothetical protein